MAVLSLSTNCCRVCNAEKPISEFYTSKNRYGVRYANNTCKVCQSRLNAESVRRPERIEAAREWRRQHKAKLRRARGVPTLDEKRARKQERLALATEPGKAREAWRYWINEKAPAEWLDAYYAASGKPWTDHRLSTAEQFKMQYRLDPEFNLKQRLRAAMKRKRQGIRIGELLRWAVERNGSSPTAEQFVGYTAKDLRRHIERQFTKGMTWDKFCAGEIHIDHIVPLSSYDISNPDELKAAWALPNLRPLWASQNIRKSASRTHLL